MLPQDNKRHYASNEIKASVKGKEQGRPTSSLAGPMLPQLKEPDVYGRQWRLVRQTASLPHQRCFCVVYSVVTEPLTIQPSVSCDRGILPEKVRSLPYSRISGAMAQFSESTPVFDPAAKESVNAGKPNYDRG